MTPLESRKQLLIAESELNRAQLVEAWQSMTDDVQVLADQAKTVRSMASAAGSLLAGLASLRRNKSAPEKTSWVQTVLKSAGWVSSLWSQFCPARSKTDLHE